jgi:serine/threonine protein kinase
VRHFRQEGVVVHGLRHPNIVRAFDIDPYGEPPYLIMEFVGGPSLRQVIDANPSGLPVAAAVEIMRGVLSALVCAHENALVHRDIKPANVLLARPPEEIEKLRQADVKVVDFGLGRTGGVTTTSLLQSGSLVTEGGRNVAGTLAYMSPEQKTSAELDGRSDLYSCGIVLFEMLTGVRPEGNELPSSVRPAVPGHLDQAFRRCYTRLERRFGSAQEMLNALAGGRGTPPPPPPGVGGARHASACPKCRQPTRPEDQFCIHCGTQLVEAVPRCQSCQAFVNKTDNFCIFCGTDLRVKAQ